MRAKPLAVSVTPVSREIELRRHTDADGDVLTDEGVAAALELGARLRGGYQLAVSTGAQRATQTLACSSPRSASRCRVASWSSRVCGRRSRTAGARRLPDVGKRRAHGITRRRPRARRRGLRAARHRTPSRPRRSGRRRPRPRRRPQPDERGRRPRPHRRKLWRRSPRAPCPASVQTAEQQCLLEGVRL